MKTALILLLFLFGPVIARQEMLLHVPKNNCDNVVYYFMFRLFSISYFRQIIIFNYNYSSGESKKTTESRKVIEKNCKHLKDIEKVIISILFLFENIILLQNHRHIYVWIF